MNTFKQVGTVEVLRTRLYPLDPTNPDARLDAIVMPGEYPLMSDGYSTLWMMTGLLNGNTIRRGDGMFTLTPSANADPLNGLEVTFPSRVYGPDEWTEFKGTDPLVLDGPDQRLVIRENVTIQRVNA